MESNNELRISKQIVTKEDHIMGFFDGKKETEQRQQPEVAACDRELAELEQHQQELFARIGKRYAEETTAEKAAGTPYEEDIAGLDKIAARRELLVKRRLAVQGLKQCENCGNILAIDSAFCNQCGGRLEMIAPEVLTDAPLCPNCKAPVEPGVLFCTRCGTRLEQMEAPGIAVADSRCPDCGAPVEPGASFCIQCGRAL